MTALDPGLERWRLILGGAAENSLPLGASGTGARRDAALEWLYGRDEELCDRGIRPGARRGGCRGTDRTTARVATAPPC